MYLDFIYSKFWISIYKQEAVKEYYKKQIAKVYMYIHIRIERQRDDTR